MKAYQGLKAISCGLCIMFMSIPAYSKTVPNLDVVPDALKYSESKRVFAEQILGVLADNEFGELPNGIDKLSFLNWLAPDENLSYLTLIGTKPWGKDGTYIGVACFARNEKNADYARKHKEAVCSEDFNLGQAKNFYIGVFELKGYDFLPLARSGLINDPISWQNSNLSAPSEADDGTAILPQSYSKLDLANYRISSEVLAFGVRSNFYEGYAGGGASFEALQLFMLKDNEIINIFSEPMFSYVNIAGEWNEDGTREHDIDEAENVLIILKNQTNGYYNIRVKNTDSAWYQDFIWSVEQQRYIPVEE